VNMKEESVKNNTMIESVVKRYKEALKNPQITDERWRYAPVQSLLSWPWVQQKSLSFDPKVFLDKYEDISSAEFDKLLLMNGHLVSGMSDSYEPIHKIFESSSYVDKIQKLMSEGKISALYIPCFKKPQGCHLLIDRHTSNRSITIDQTFMTDERSIIPVLHHVEVAPGQKFTLFEYVTNQGDADHFTRQLMTIHVGINAKFHHYRLYLDGTKHLRYSSTFIDIDSEGSYQQYFLNFGSSFSRHETSVNLKGEKAATSFSGAYLGKHRGNNEVAIDVQHLAQKTTSSQRVYGVALENARIVFQGNIDIRPGMGNVNANQINKNLLLSDNAQVVTCPQLKVQHNQVVCSHGATVSSLDQDEIFYLRTRGIQENSARKLLTLAFFETLWNKKMFIHRYFYRCIKKYLSDLN